MQIADKEEKKKKKKKRRENQKNWYGARHVHLR
jgi:hypothetical protein